MNKIIKINQKRKVRIWEQHVANIVLFKAFQSSLPINLYIYTKHNTFRCITVNWVRQKL